MLSMVRDVARRQLILAYDGDCPMCLGIVRFLSRTGLVAAEQLVSNHDLSPSVLERARAAGIRNQLVVLDSTSGETRSGVDGLLWIVGEMRGHPLWLRLLSLPGIRHLLRRVYETVSYNRRIISPPHHAIRCDCEPDATLARRLALIVPLALVAAACWALFGAAAFVGLNLGDAVEGVAFVVTAAGSGWIALVLGAFILLGGQPRIDYLAHLTITAFVGALVLVPAGVVAWWLPATANAVLASASVLLSLVVMFRMQRRRVGAVGLSRVWLWAWMVAVVSGSLAVTLVYFGAEMPP